MAKTVKAARAPKSSGSRKTGGSETLTLSVRFTEEQRQYLERAGALKGWSLARLLRTAALERAAHIINVESQTRLDFQAVASKLANVLCTKRRVRCYGVDDIKDCQTCPDLREISSLDFMDPEDPPYEVSPWHLTADEVEQLAAAANYGGAEFLARLIEAARSVSSDRNQLPEPVDPAKLAE